MTSIAMRSAEAVATMRPVFEDLMGTFAEHRLALGRFHGSAETLFIKQHSPRTEIIPAVLADKTVGVFRRRTEPRVVRMQQRVEHPRDTYIDVLAGDIRSQLVDPGTRPHAEEAVNALAVVKADLDSLISAESKTAASVASASKVFVNSIEELNLGDAEKAPIISNVEQTMARSLQLLHDTPVPIIKWDPTHGNMSIKQATDFILNAVEQSLDGTSGPAALGSSLSVKMRSTTNQTHQLPATYKREIHPRIQEQLDVFDDLATYFDALSLRVTKAGADADVARAAVNMLTSRAELRAASNTNSTASLKHAVSKIHEAGGQSPFRAGVEKASELAAHSDATFEIAALPDPQATVQAHADAASQAQAIAGATRIAAGGSWH